MLEIRESTYVLPLAMKIQVLNVTLDNVISYHTRNGNWEDYFYRIPNSIYEELDQPVGMAGTLEGEARLDKQVGWTHQDCLMVLRSMAERRVDSMELYMLGQCLHLPHHCYS